MLIPVILSGGAGTRLWPVSRSAYPKPFMRMADGETLLYKTLERALRVAEGGSILTVTGRDYYFLTRDEYARHPQADLDRLPFLLEPAGRNTAPAVVLAALYAREQIDPAATLLVLPADHLIADIAAFLDDAHRSAALAEQGWLVTFGIKPTQPETGFGYIRMGAPIAESGGRQIAAFVEKPNLQTAQGYLASGEYSWNSGMFCFRADVLLEAAQHHCPDVLAAAQACYASATGTGSPVEFEREAFLAMPDISLDYAVMERADRRAVVPAAFDWNDIGSWKAISELESDPQADAAGNRIRGSAIVVESENCYIQGDKRMVAAVGVKNLLIVDTGDAVLVADRERSQQVKLVVEQLRESGHDSARFHQTVHRPWGSFTVLEDEADCKVKRLTVKPGGVLSLQLHHRRSEHWTVVTGTAKVRVGDEEFLLGRNESTYIPVETLHRLENPTDTDLHLIEVQCGDYFGEDDIVRLEDKYGRSASPPAEPRPSVLPVHTIRIILRYWKTRTAKESSMRFAIAAFALIPTLVGAAPHPFDVHDLVMMERVSDPQLAPDGKRVAYQLRQTDYAANKGINSIWIVSLSERNAKPAMLTETPFTSQTSPRWSPDGGSVYVLAGNKDQPGTQVWRIDASKGGNGAAQRLTNLPLDVNNYKLSPDGKQILLSLDVFPDCADLACTKKRLDEKAANKATGTLYDKVFIRHWDTWADGRRSQLFIADVPATGAISEPRLLTKGIDGDVPSKPFGDDGEYAFSPDGRTVYFDARIAGKTEPWSTNFDIYSVPADGSAAPKNLTASNAAWDANPLPSADGKTLYYAAMKRPTFEADRFGIMALDLASGQAREIDPKWDRSAGALQLSKDGKTLFTVTYDNGDHALFAVDIGSGKATRLGATGHVEGFSVLGNDIVFARSTLKTPTDLFRIGTGGGKETQVTHLNTERLADARMGDYEFYTFKGADNATVQGYVVKPVGYEKGKKYPVAFIIHGGPQGAMTNDFHYRWNPQTYAGAGFAVVTVNFHGSTGYGQAFTDSISGDWGGKPLEDLQKGWAAALEKYNFLDGGRACALGASYGGFMINWIAGNWSLPWKCLVVHDGVFDSRMMSYSTEELWFDEWEHRGTQWENAQAYEKYNPVNHVGDWKVPMLVVQGQKDFRIPLEQGIAAFTALQRRGIPSEFLVFPDENHWVLKPHNSVLWHDTVNAWLTKWTKAAN